VEKKPLEQLMEKGRQREIVPNDSNRFVFCSSNGAHLRWLAHALRDLVITNVPFMISSFCTNGVAAYEDKHTGAQGRVDGDG
jgi:hypothetical protein